MSNKKEIENFIKKLENAKKTVNSELGNAISKCCIQVQRTIQEGFTATVTNDEVSYFTHNKRIPHHPSVLGNYPAVDTGTLRRSISFDVEKKGNKIIGRIGSTILEPPYPAFLEYGTSKMFPRPWLKPSMDKNETFIQNMIDEALRKGIK